MTPPHGTNNRYASAYCRCEPCVAAHTLYHKQWQRRVLTQGPRLIPADRAGQQLADMRRQGITGVKIARLIGMNHQQVQRIANGRIRKITRHTADLINQLWQDTTAPIDPEQRDLRRYPAGPLHQAVIHRYGSIKAIGPTAASRLHKLAHTGLSSRQTSQWADRLGVTEYELWPDWGQPEPQQETG